MPGRNWVEGFMKRNPHLSLRTANLIKRTRAAVDHKEFTFHGKKDLNEVISYEVRS